MLCSFKSPPPSHNEGTTPCSSSHAVEQDTCTHLHNPRNLDLAAPTLPWCTGLLQPSTSTVLVKHLNSSNPHPPFPRHYVFTTSSLVLKCVVCIVLCVFGGVQFWIKAAVARICSFYLHPSYENCVFGLHPKIHESIFGQFLWRQNFSSMGVVVFIIGQLSLYPVTTFQDFIDFICLRSPNTFLSYLIMVESESNKD